MRKLDKFFAMLVAMLGVGTLSAQTWTAPVVGVSLSDIDSSTELYLYNVKADAFACSGMNWQTHAIVKELQYGDSQLSAAVHNCTINKPADGQVQISLNEKQYLGGGGAASTNDCWVDQANNNDVYTYTETSTNVYKLKPTTATGESYLDCSWAYGGHITFSGTNGYGNTEWAFVLRSDITSGKYLLYKAKKEMYDIYEALVAAGQDGTYADALATANAAYVATDATAASVNAATKTLLAAVSPVLSSKYFAANSLFNSPDMRGYGDDTDWGNGLNAFADGIFESWHSSETITQTQTGLPNGFYTVVFLGMYRQDGSDAAPTLTLTSGENSSVSSLKALSEIDFGSIAGAASGSWSSDKPYNTYGAGEALAHTDAGVKVEGFLVENGELTITVAMPSTSQWLLCQGFQIFYKGIDVSGLQSSLTTLLESANAIKDLKMGATESTALNTAISNANVESTDKDELSSMISALQSAYDAAVPSVDFYATVLPYITKAEAIDASIATDYRTQYDNGTISESAETVFQNLEVATYNYVTGNFEYPVALSDTWNSTGTNTSAADFTGEHWSDDNTRNYKNQFDGWGDPKQGYPANSWSIDFDQEVTLPAGKYVFKVAGRKEKATTLKLVVTQGETELGTVSDFPSGNTGLGINKAGVTSFDANDATGFANNGSGRGWQWRYVKFELEAEATVKVAVHAETSTIYNWVSFGDYTLQMTEETYLEANKGGVEAAEAAAQALVDTIPMGGAEKEALSKALAMTYTTGAEMLAKVEALETAVANANAWLTAYNEAKAPLVAALERFEADYNDGENGAKDHMAKSRWETVLAMVQAATEAKDVTNSYDGFAAATENLVAALDSATVSVNEYADLKKAIDAANALVAVEVNWGDEPFQRPESAKDGLDTTDEQALYDAAEADGEGVTSVTGALNAAMDITLNVPATGDAYYITVATAGHAYEGYPIVATSGSTGDNNPTGYGYTANATDATATKLYTFTQVEGNLYNISFEMNGETVYMTYGSLNGSAADWKNSQIQGNTDVTKAGKFEIEASTTTEGAIKICNTVTGTYLDCQAGGPIYTDDALTNEEFALIEQNTQLSASINISSENQLSTCVLQFDAALPDGLEAYVGTSVENGCLILEQVTGTLSAYTPCLLYAENGATETLSGTIVMNGYAHKVTVDSLLYGAIEAYTITEGYVLQNQGEGAKFHTVSGQTVTIPAGKCWLSVPQSSETDATPAAVSLRFTNGGATKLNPVLMDKTVQDGAIYTIDGKRVERMERGQIYIINGQKVMIK